MAVLNYTDLTKTTLWEEREKPRSLPSTSVTTKMWVHSVYLALLLYIPFFIYAYFQIQSISLLTASIAAAATAAIMIGLSFALSGLCYYFNFLDTKIAYRKYLGLVGYWLALSHAISLLFINPKKYLYGFFDNLLTADIILGLAAISILSFMALISHNSAMKMMGVTTWRYGLRLGYVAYFFLVVRAFVLEHEMWMNWFLNPLTLPPLRLIISIFALSVILLRLSIIVSKK